LYICSSELSANPAAVIPVSPYPDVRSDISVVLDSRHDRSKT
jgi:hypothetical protein